jgi:3-hydroxyacyl-[acyl-carrier-protein] dehydratase
LTPQQILAALPYSKPFLFVDELVSLSPNQAVGHYTYRPDEFFYAGHFVGKPVTPGVILLETMAQIGGVALGFIYWAMPCTPTSHCLATSKMPNFMEPYCQTQKLLCKVPKNILGATP